MSSNSLSDLHCSLCHPGITRLNHYIKSKNLPYSVDDVKRVCSTCLVCAELKPRYYKPIASHLIKATQPWERINLDFKGPLPSSSKNQYILTVIDEFSRFPFAIPCPDVSTPTVVKCLTQLFSFCIISLAFVSTEIYHLLSNTHQCSHLLRNTHLCYQNS